MDGFEGHLSGLTVTTGTGRLSTVIPGPSVSPLTNHVAVWLRRMQRDYFRVGRDAGGISIRFLLGISLRNSTAGAWRRWFEQYRGGVQISLVADLANLFIQAENDRRERLT
jgi:hypothetical protein